MKINSIDKIISELQPNDFQVSTVGELRFSRKISSILSSENGKAQLKAVKALASKKKK